MKQVFLRRFAYTPQGTFGRLEVDGFTCFTVERPWMGNERNISCIPTGYYRLELGTHRRNTPDPSDDYPCYEVKGVLDRSLIKIHIANTIEDVKGCIGLGCDLGYNTRVRRWAVLCSRRTHEQFMEAMAGVPSAMLSITDEFPVDWREN
ncbi:MAG: hypothetical protein GTO22_00380 [Gemmatimonadales bacterium]|nr:hypothetical protein [Gemmatimonadales bacterium]